MLRRSESLFHLFDKSLALLEPPSPQGWAKGTELRYDAHGAIVGGCVIGVLRHNTRTVSQMRRALRHVRFALWRNPSYWAGPLVLIRFLNFLLRLIWCPFRIGYWVIAVRAQRHFTCYRGSPVTLWNDYKHRSKSEVIELFEQLREYHRPAYEKAVLARLDNELGDALSPNAEPEIGRGRSQGTSETKGVDAYI